MSGKPASRIGDGVVQGVIVQGSMTVLVGSSGGVACSVCPGGMAVGSPVNPALGAKVLANETDFALPSATLPLVWSRTYSSYVNPEHGGACGVLGYGWHLASCDIRLELHPGHTLLFDASGRTITFPEPLTPGAALHSRSESIWLLRGGKEAPWCNEPCWCHIPPEWATDPGCVIATTGNKTLYWRFTQFPGCDGWHPTELRDRLGNAQYYTWLPPLPGQPGEAPSPMLLGETNDGAGRRYRLHYLPLYPSRLAGGPGWCGQAGWQADYGWRLVQIELLEDPGYIAWSLDKSARKVFEVAQSSLKHPDIPNVGGIILVRYDYDPYTGDLVRVRNHANTATREFSTRNHLLIGHRHRGGPLHGYEYEAYEPGAKVIAQYNEGGLNYTFSYLEDKEQPELSHTIIRDNLWREQTYTFEGKGGLKRPIRHKRADGSLFVQEYDAAGHLTGITDPLGRKTQMVRDGEGRLIGLEDPAQQRSRADYDELGQLTETEESGRITRYQYDPWGRLVGITHPDETQERFRYPAPGQGRTANLPNQVIDARGGTKHLKWNPAGQLISYTDCSNKTTCYRYSPWGGVLTETDALGQNTRFERDHTDNPLSITLPDGGTTHYEYDAQGQLVGTTAPDGTRQHFSHDAHGRLIESTDASGCHRRYQYDQAGRLISLENENGATARFSYDIMDRLTQETGFDRRTQRYGYDLLGQLTDKIEESLPTRPMTRYVYDEVGNLIERHLPANGPIQPITERFEWGEDGLLASAHGLGGKTEYKYDQRGRLRAEAQSQLHQDGQLWQWKHRQELNELGVKRRNTYGNLPPIDWLTYGAGHLHGISLAGFAIDFERDGLHREIERNIRTNHAKLLFFSDTAYNALGNIAARGLGIGGRIREEARYRYDKQARLIEIQTPTSTTRYEYDQTGRLTGSRHGSQAHQYAFDAAGNRIDPKAIPPEKAAENWAKTVRQRLADPNFNPLAYTPPEKRAASWVWIDNRIVELNGIRNTYDGAGNLTEQTRTDGTRLKLYYDGAFRLSALTKTNPDGSQVDAWYGYDAFSRRIAKGVTERGKEKITRYGWDGDLLVHEATEETLITIIYAPGSVAPLMRIEQGVKKEEEKGEREQAAQEAMKLVEGMLAAGGMELKKPQAAESELRVSFFVTDHAGTPSKLIDEEGQTIWAAEPDDWAAVRDEKGVRQPIRFQGQWLDEETGFYYNRYRYYDPAQGRYITQDPIGLEGGDNLQSYAYGDPINYIDPTGEIAFVPILIGLGVGFAFDYALEQYKEKHCNCQPTCTAPLVTAGNATMGGVIGGSGDFVKKPRTGLGGGGPSGDKTSVFSEMNHLAAKKDMYSTAVRNKITKKLRWASKRIPYVGAAITASEVYYVVSCSCE